MNQTRFSISAVSRITGIHRNTIANHMKKGKLSYKVDDDGNKYIEGSEISRVYPDQVDFSAEEGSGAKQQAEQSANANDGSSNSLLVLQERLKLEQDERERERKQFQQQLDHIKEALDKSMEGHNRATMLLENQTQGVGDWEQSIKSLESKIEKMQEQQLTLRKREMKLRRILNEERNKPLWKRIWK